MRPITTKMRSRPRHRPITKLIEGDALGTRSTFKVVGAKICMGLRRSLLLSISVVFSVVFGLLVTLDAFVAGLDAFNGTDIRDHHASPSKPFVGTIFFIEASRAGDTVVDVRVAACVEEDGSEISENAGAEMSALAVVEDALDGWVAAVVGGVLDVACEVIDT